jgi:hypothetical protein
MTLAEKTIELETILSALNEDEKEVVIGSALKSARAMAKGRKEYGPLNLAADKRNFVAEAAEESVDQKNYFEMDEIRLDRAAAAARNKKRRVA